MGRHAGSSAAETPGTDNGMPYGSLSGEQRASEFDGSHNDPSGYADRNFPQATGGSGARVEPVQQGRQYPDPNKK